MRPCPARRGERGQALVEMGIVLMLLLTLMMGTVEFGRAWMISNMVTHAARNAARAAAVVPPASRSASAIQAQVWSEIGNLVSTSGFSVNVTPSAATVPPTISVTVNATVDYVFGLWGSNFTVARTVTFRDEQA